MSINRSQILLVSILFVAVAFFVLEKTNNLQQIQKPNFEKASFSEKDDPWARIEYENNMLKDPATGKIPDNIRSLELEYAKTLPKAENKILAKGTNTASLTWNPRGPYNRGGRTRALGIDVRTQTPGSVIIIAGGVSGGIWKSTNDGTTWVNKMDPSYIHSVTCLAQDTRTGHEDTWYAAGGEGSGNSATGGGGAFYRGDGVFKSTNNGETWTVLGATGTQHSFNSPFRYVWNIAVNKATGSVFAAASNTIQKSTDGGSTWSIVRGAFTSSAATDIQITSTGTIYATIPTGYTNSGIWKSTDDGVTWTSIRAGFSGRTVIGIAPSNESIVYFWAYINSGATGTQLEKYDGTSFTNLTSNLPGPSGNVAGTNPQGAYNMVIKVKPDDPNFVLMGGTNLYRSTDGISTPVPAEGSTNWIGGYSVNNDISQYANHHPDQHSLVFLNSAGNYNVLYSGHDGGISRTNNVTASNLTWTDLNNGYITTQFYSVAIDPTTANDNHMIGGLQDNGNWWTSSSNFNTNWVELALGGDGGFTEITNGHTDYYFETQNGKVWRFQLDANGAYTNFAKVQPNYTTNYMFINPFVLDPNNNKVMYLAAGDTVFRNSDLTGIFFGNQNPTGTNWSFLINSSTGSSVSAIGVSKTPANKIYVGSSLGKILRFDNPSSVSDIPSDVSTGKGLPANSYVSCIAVDPNDGNRALVVFSNYSIPSLFYTSTGGASWADVSGNLEQNVNGSGNGPSCRWASILKIGSSNTYYVATSTGLYSTSNLNGSSTVWSQEGSTTIGNVVSSMVKTRESDGLVVVSTHGAGIYSANQSTVGIESESSIIPSDYSLSQNYPNPFNPSTKIKFTLPSPENVKISIYDITGRKVKDILNQNLTSGTHTVDFDASDLASGTYIYRINAGSFVQSKKMVLLK